jgi:hypothetical protein
MHDVYHDDYNLFYKTKSSLQENLEGLITRARVKQLQRVLASQIKMIEAVCLELVQRFLFAYN